MIRVINSLAAFTTQIDYTLSVIFSVYGLRYELRGQGSPENTADITVYYGENRPEDVPVKFVFIRAAGFFGDGYLKPESMPPTPLPRYDGMPVICCRGEPYVNSSAGSVETNIDVIASIFFMLSCYEEMINNHRDEFDRFPARASLAYREKCLDRPLVNEYIELLWRWLKTLAPGLERVSPWPAGKTHAVCLTHDIDAVRKYEFGNMLKIAWRRARSGLARSETITSASPAMNGAPGSASGLFDVGLEYGQILLHLKRDPYDTFEYLLDAEGRRGFRSSFYFMATGADDADCRYLVDNSRVKSLIRRIEKAGCEVGLHGSYDSFDRPDKMVAEKKLLDSVVGEKVFGCRQHYLRQKFPATWRAQSQAGLLYDASLGFADRVGFRCGFCLPFRLFDLEQNRVLDLWEIPLTVMEASYEYPDYAQESPEALFKDIIRHLETVRNFGGVFVLLWHNSSLNSKGNWTRQGRTFERILDCIDARGALVTSGREIISLWEGRMGSVGS